MTRVTLLLLTCALLPACEGTSMADSGPLDDGGEAVEPITFYFWPPDRTTNTGGEPSLEIAWFAPVPPDDPRLAETEAALRLTREPIGDAVAFDVSRVRDSDGMVRLLRVTPVELLEEDFHRLWVSRAALPEGVDTSQTVSPDGTHGVRFHVASMPLVRLVGQCVGSGGPELSLRIQFSEPMAADTAEHVTIEGASCGDGSLSAVTPTSVTFSCTHVASTVTFRVDTASVRSATGRALVEPEGADGAYTLTPAEAQEQILGCSNHYPFWPVPE